MHNGGSAAHWPFSIAGSIRRQYRTLGLCHLSPLQRAEEMAEHLVFQCPAHDQAQRQTWPDQRVSTGSVTAVELSGAKWGGDPPPPPTGNERLLQLLCCYCYYTNQMEQCSSSLWWNQSTKDQHCLWLHNSTAVLQSAVLTRSLVLAPALDWHS